VNGKVIGNLTVESARDLARGLKAGE